MVRTLTFLQQKAAHIALPLLLFDTLDLQDF
jgi:hypothetical protein